MRNQTHRKVVKNVAKKRRGYLAKKSASYGQRTVATGVFYFFAALAVVFFVGWSQSILNWSLLMFSLACAAIGATGLLVQRIGFRTARTLEYVPPVHQLIATLPADEVLVRGSYEPAASPGELLRAAIEGKDTASEELLRPGPSANSDPLTLRSYETTPEVPLQQSIGNQGPSTERVGP